ncbi:MAG TPA: NADH-quinone oxidoreductase subunit N [Acidobacteriota bacterium]
MPPLAELRLAAIAPELILTATAIAILMIEVLRAPGRNRFGSTLTLAGLALAVYATLAAPAGAALEGTVIADGLTRFARVLIAAVTALIALAARPELRRAERERGEFYALLLFAATGMMVLASAAELMTLFIGLEIFSLALYVLAGYLRERVECNEASLKYFLMGAVSSGFFLYGIALIYGATGTTFLAAIQPRASDPLVLSGAALLLVGFAFKLSIVPFHMWTPDVYQGSPTIVTGFMTAATKAAAFCALLRTFRIGLVELEPSWSASFTILAALTMVLGNVAALAQRDLKRMLAYSSIAHAGYVLIGLTAGTNAAAGAMLFYLLVYALMGVGAFCALAALTPKVGDSLLLDDLAGLSQRRPLAAAALAIFLFSLTGIPPTAGFMAKLYLFGAAVEAGQLPLVVLALLTSAIAAFYYLRPIVVMYMHAPADAGLPRPALGAAAVLLVTALLTLALGLAPGPALAWATQSLP